jgi:hypothetical protein
MPVMTLCSVDAESNGLHGQPFAIGAVVVDDEAGERCAFYGRCPISGPVDPWVAENVLPVLAGLPETYGTYEALLAGFGSFLLEEAFEVPVVAHVAWPVEARLFADLYQVGEQSADPWRAASVMPYPLHDVASMLWLAGEDPTSVDGYLAKHGLPKPPGSAHHPLYDARAAERAARHLLGRFRDGGTAP